MLYRWIWWEIWMNRESQIRVSVDKWFKFIRINSKSCDALALNIPFLVCVPRIAIDCFFSLYFIESKCVSGSIKSCPKKSIHKYVTHILYKKCTLKHNIQCAYIGTLWMRHHFAKIAMVFTNWSKIKSSHCKHGIVLDDLIYSVFETTII